MAPCHCKRCARWEVHIDQSVVTKGQSGWECRRRILVHGPIPVPRGGAGKRSGASTPTKTVRGTGARPTVPSRHRSKHLCMPVLTPCPAQFKIDPAAGRPGIRGRGVPQAPDRSSFHKREPMTPATAPGHPVPRVRSLALSVPFCRDVPEFNEVAPYRGQRVFFSLGRNHHDSMLMEMASTRRPRDSHAVGMHYFAQGRRQSRRIAGMADPSPVEWRSPDRHVGSPGWPVALGPGLRRDR
jgi:hypothetical protein